VRSRFTLFRQAPWVFLLAASLAARPAGAAERDPSGRLCDLGITLALTGRSAEAESVFVSLLSRSPEDARALNNLGNLRLWRGEPDVALEFFRAAGEADTADAGISLNEAIAWLVQGNEELARQSAEKGIQRAGGITNAAGLLGILYDESETAPRRSADRARMSREQALDLLRAAARAVPADSTKHSAATPDSGRAVGRVRAWRSAGARGGDASDAAAMVYWKH